MIKVAVVGNPNVGKTALINYLTNSNLKIGNWPGVTVEKKEAFLKYKDQDIYFIDLPGVYNLTPYTLEEQITRDYLLNEKVDLILNVIDSKNFKKNLALTSQLLEFEIPTLIVLNMWDEVPSNFNIDTKKLEDLLQVKVVKASAKKEFGKSEILNNILYLKEKYVKPRYLIFEKNIENILKTLPFVRFVNVKLLEGDKDILKNYENRLPSDLKEKLENEKRKLEKKFKKHISDVIFSERYKWINAIYYQVSKGYLEDTYSLTDKIDDIILYPKLAPIFLLIFIYMFFKIIFTLTDPVISYIEIFQEFLTSLINKINLFGMEILKDFIKSVFIEGLGLLLSFVPLIFFIYFIFALLEDSGIIARFSLLSDRFLHKLGLHGNAIIPIILGYGCNVPAVTATRALNTVKEKVIVATSIPFTLCGARLPVIAFLTLNFFPTKKTLLTLFIYILSLILTLSSILLLKRLENYRISNEILIELPNYRIPKISYAIKYGTNKVIDFLKGASSIVFISLMILYLLLNFPPKTTIENSLAAQFAQVIAPIFKPLNMDIWEVIISLFPGAVAKETIVASLKEVLSLTKNSLNQLINFKGAISYIIFSSFYIPCIATLAIIKKEVGLKYMLLSIIISLSFAYITAFIFSNVLFYFLVSN